MLKVEPIQNGVVIDHIPAGRGMEIYRLLHLESKHQAVALLQSVRSEKYGTKDLIKIEGSNLPERLEILGYLDRLMTHSWGQKVIRFYDLDGNLIEVGTPV